MELKIRHLRLVQAVRREGTVSLGARRLRLTQPAVSHGLREIEEGFGVRLFERRARQMKATEAGQRLAEAADRVLGLLEVVGQDLEQLGAGRKGVLRIATECYTCYHWLPRVLGTFRRSWPGFEMRIVPEAKTEPREALRRRDLDLAITHTVDAAPDLVTVPLFRDELVAIMAPGHPLASRPCLMPEDFADQELILHSDPQGSIVFRSFLTPAGVEPRHISLLQLTEAVMAAVRADLGISVLARWAAAPELDAGNLVAVPLTDTGLHRQWSATVLAEHRHQAPLAALIELLERDLPTAAVVPASVSGPTLLPARKVAV